MQKCELNKPAHWETRGWVRAGCSGPAPAIMLSKYPVLTEVTALTHTLQLTVSDFKSISEQPIRLLSVLLLKDFLILQ